ncbi:MAG: 2,3-diphosphoglycerate-dependent phosphoglycerate mutase [Candidatus Neomarinimicrobiota bacterium]|nr:2,3-diphosphoglycerate-dependent phosphoglycerate mutase [Candidatus Neomarinimicrobiota bacterium]
MKLILLRHGESLWNLENKFTGWKDVSLTPLGISEAKYSGEELLKNNLQVKSIYTSLLNRATETTDIVAGIINFPKNEIKIDWRLNERHYGALQGLNKSETASKYGEEQVKIWRRSYDIPPPLLEMDDERHPKFNDKFKNILGELPAGESLKNVIDRIKPFWNKYMDEIINNNGDHLIVAHSNSLRAIIKILEGLSETEIIEVNIPTGVPLVYELDNKLNIIDKKYLIDEETLNRKKKIVENQGKIK